MSDDMSQWWATAIIEMDPGKISYRGEPVEQAIVQKSFSQMIWHMVMGTSLEGHRTRLFEAALVAAVDHGPQAPSIAAARMAATCGVGLNNAIATGVNLFKRNFEPQMSSTICVKLLCFERNFEPQMSSTICVKLL